MSVRWWSRAAGEMRPHDDDRVRIADLLVTVALLAFCSAATAPAGLDQEGARVPDLPAYLLVTAAVVPLVWWRRRPVHLVAVNAAATAAYLALGYPFGPILFAGALAAAGLAVRRPLGTVAVTALLAAAALAAGIVVGQTGSNALADVGQLVATLLSSVGLWVALPCAIGVAVRIRGEANARVREEQARRAVSEERLAMAQEVHDVVGHGLAVIAMQAGVGLHLLDRNPRRAREALEAIRVTSRDALDGLRAELATMRGQGAAAAPHRPRAGLSDVPALVDRVRSAGVDVRLELGTTTDDVPEQVDLAAYRVVQESLTNVLRHAGSAAAARVAIRRDAGQLRVDVTDSGRGPAVGALHDGSGITGMRERAVRLGGTLDAAGEPGGGFAVRACLPLGPAQGRRSA